MPTQQPVIRQAVLGDAPALARCHVACWQEAYASLLSTRLLEGLDLGSFQRRWQQRLAETLETRVRVAVAADRIIGFAMSGPSRDDPPVRGLELMVLYSRAAHHGSGLGQALLDAVVGGAPCSLWLARNNPRAYAFYTRNGFVPDGTSMLNPSLEDLVDVRLVR